MPPEPPADSGWTMTCDEETGLIYYTNAADGSKQWTLYEQEYQMEPHHSHVLAGTVSYHALPTEPHHRAAVLMQSLYRGHRVRKDLDDEGIHMPGVTPLFAGWVEEMQQTWHKPFYVHVRSNERRWQPPAPGVHSMWSRHRDVASGRTFYHNSKTHQDRYTHYTDDDLVSADAQALILVRHGACGLRQPRADISRWHQASGPGALNRVTPAVLEDALAPGNVPHTKLDTALADAVPVTRNAIKAQTVLVDGWIQRWDDDSGRLYFYNMVTGHSTWIPPETDDASFWQRRRDDVSKRTFYANPTSTISRWTLYVGEWTDTVQHPRPLRRLPSQGSSRSLMGRAVPTVTDGTTAVSAQRAVPDAYTAGAGAAGAGAAADTPLSDREQMAALRSTRAAAAPPSEPSVSARNAGNTYPLVEGWVQQPNPLTGEMEYVHSATGLQQVEPPEMSQDSNWVRDVDGDTNRSFYYHRTTGETRWTQPDISSQIPVAVPEHTSAVADGSSTEAGREEGSSMDGDVAAPKLKASAVELIDGWWEKVDSAGVLLYHNQVTSEIRAAPPLPASQSNWKRGRDLSTGVVFYVHKLTGQRRATTFVAHNGGTPVRSVVSSPGHSYGFGASGIKVTTVDTSGSPVGRGYVRSPGVSTDDDDDDDDDSGLWSNPTGALTHPNIQAAAAAKSSSRVPSPLAGKAPKGVRGRVGSQRTLDDGLSEASPTVSIAPGSPASARFGGLQRPRSLRMMHARMLSSGQTEVSDGDDTPTSSQGGGFSQAPSAGGKDGGTWEEHKHAETGQLYLYNPVTGESKWAGGDSADAVDAVVVWSTAYDDESGMPYYINSVTEESEWTLPRIQDAPKDQWECSACTFHNGIAADVCQMCENARPPLADAQQRTSEADAFANVSGYGVASKAEPVAPQSSPAGSMSGFMLQAFGGAESAPDAKAAADPAPAAGADEHPKGAEWTCPLCTLSNAGALAACQACGALRPT